VFVKLRDHVGTFFELDRCIVVVLERCILVRIVVL
jgi:hypothetical protein